MKAELVIEIIKLVIAAACTAIPFIIGIGVSIKKAKNAKAESERKSAIIEMTDYARKLVVSVEESYAAVNNVLKQQGGSAGTLKKEQVMSKLQAYALSNGYEYNEEEYSKLVDDIVASTRVVNAR